MPIFRRKKKNDSESTPIKNVWARPEMNVTFRAEIMPGRTREERTFRVKLVRPNGRVMLYDFPDEHREKRLRTAQFPTRPGKPLNYHS